MADKTPTATRRGILAALAGTAAFAGTIGAAIAAPAQAEAMPGEPTPEGNRLYDEAHKAGFEEGEKQGAEIALYHTARAFIDRWRAAGGDFGLSGSRVMFGVMEPAFWEPTDHDNERLAPHIRLTEPEHQAGAIKVLEAMLVLVPGLREAVREIVGVQLLAAREA